MKIKPLIFSLFILALLLPPARAKVLDNFDDNTKTAWTDFTFLNGFGLPVEQNGQFKFNLPAAGQSIFSASTKTSETFTLQEGRRITFSVDLVGTNGPDAFALLSFIPKSVKVADLQGYSMAKSSQNFVIAKGINKYFKEETPDPPVLNEDVTMVMTLTMKGGNVIINGRVLDRETGSVLYEQTVVDTPAADTFAQGSDSPAAPWQGEGNFVLIAFQETGTTQASYEVTFDNAEAYVQEEVIVDDFNDNTKTQWTDFTFQAGFGLPVEQDGQFKFVQPPAGTSIFSASTKSSPTFQLVEGERLEFRADVETALGNDSFAILSFIPQASASQVSGLAGYSIAQSASDVLIPKGINKYFFNEHVRPEVKNQNVTLVLTMTVKSGNVIITGQVLDKDQDNLVIFEYTAVDTPAADVLKNGTDSPAAPYLGAGNFVLYCYQDEGTTQESYEVTFDNAIAWRTPAAGNTAPSLTDIEPQAYRNFLPAATTSVRFTASDDQPLPDNGISITLNGTVHTTANGLTLTGPTNARQVSLGGLSPETAYTAVLKVVDASAVERLATLSFDTFLPSDYVIEVEDYNFGGGSFWDNPVPIAEGTGPQENSYAGQYGYPGVDYFDTRTTLDDVPYRNSDYPRMQRTLDYTRAKFTAAGGAELGFYDYAVGDFQPGEWTNYTRTFPAGTYAVYLRQSMVNTEGYTSVLEEVTGDTTAENQTTVPLGTFHGQRTGFQLGNIPLTNAAGTTPVFLTLGGVKTLRLHQTGTVAGDGAVAQDYLIFVRQAAAEGNFVITSITRNPATGAVTFTWPSEPSKTYKVEASADMTATTWTTLAPAHSSQGAATSYTDTPPAGLARRFYRVSKD